MYHLIIHREYDGEIGLHSRWDALLPSTCNHLLTDKWEEVLADLAPFPDLIG